jgi:pyridoxal phosphate enzyme (YggS family)
MEKLSDEVFASRCADFEENFKIIQENIATAAIQSGRKPEDIHLLAATKTVPHELIAYATEHGIRLIGENRAQELNEKYPFYQLPKEQIHFIGHLQTNKVSTVVGKVGMIQSVDSLKLAKEISKKSQAMSIHTDVLIEVNVGEEENKSGVAVVQAADLISQIADLPNISVKGLMTIPPITDTPDEARKYFSNIYQLSVDIRQKNMDNVFMDILSMGMSSDYKEAILEGANMVRIGSLLFGKRIYK